MRQALVWLLRLWHTTTVRQALLQRQHPHPHKRQAWTTQGPGSGMTLRGRHGPGAGMHGTQGGSTVISVGNGHRGTQGSHSDMELRLGPGACAPPKPASGL